MSRRSFAPLLVCLALLTAGCGGEQLPARVGNRAPSFSLDALDGTKVTSRSLEGEVVVLNFWATWCQPCMAEIPELNQLAAESDVRVVGIALDKDGARVVQPFVDRQGINYTVLIGNEEVFQLFSGINIPHTVLVDREYGVAKMYRGRVTREALEKDLEAIM